MQPEFQVFRKLFAFSLMTGRKPQFRYHQGIVCRWGLKACGGSGMIDGRGKDESHDFVSSRYLGKSSKIRCSLRVYIASEKSIKVWVHM